MFEVIESDVFGEWLNDLKDHQASGKIHARIARLRMGHFGDVEPVGDGVIEAKIKGKGPGYRFYYAIEGRQIILLLCGGDKSTQHKDIERARDIWLRRKP